MKSRLTAVEEKSLRTQLKLQDQIIMNYSIIHGHNNEPKTMLPYEQQLERIIILDNRKLEHEQLLIEIEEKKKILQSLQ